MSSGKKGSTSLSTASTAHTECSSATTSWRLSLLIFNSNVICLHTAWRLTLSKSNTSHACWMFCWKVSKGSYKASKKAELSPRWPNSLSAIAQTNAAWLRLLSSCSDWCLSSCREEAINRCFRPRGWRFPSKYWHRSWEEAFLTFFTPCSFSSLRRTSPKRRMFFNAS